MGDDDQIAALHQMFAVTSIVFSNRPDPILKICPQPGSPLVPGAIDLGSSNLIRADRLAEASAQNAVCLHAGLHFNAALPNEFFHA